MKTGGLQYCIEFGFVWCDLNDYPGAEILKPYDFEKRVGVINREEHLDEITFTCISKSDEDQKFIELLELSQGVIL
jgi:hypothetical protein